MLLLLPWHCVNACHFLHQVVLVQRGVQPAAGDGLDHCNSLNAGCRAQAVPDHGLGGVHLDVAGVGEDLLDGLDLSDVANQRAAAQYTDKLVFLDNNTTTLRYRAGCDTQ